MKRDEKDPEIHLHIRSPVVTMVPSEDAIWFAHALEFNKAYYRPGRFARTRVTYTASAFFEREKKYWSFYTGLVPRVARVCKEGGYKLHVYNKAIPSLVGTFKHRIEPQIDGLQFRYDQKIAIEKLLKAKRGCLVAPTAYGKTRVMMGLASCMYDQTILILVDKKSIVEQTYESFKKSFAGVKMIHGESKISGFSRITIATRQSIANMLSRINVDQFDVVMIDEVHKVSSFDGQYASILSYLQAPIRFGFTGTFPSESISEHREKILAIESFVGPKITEVSSEEAIKMGIISKPKVKIILEEKKESFKTLTWQETYQKAIVRNDDHNYRVAEEAINAMDKKESVLIFVNTVDHMLEIHKIIAESAPDLSVKKVHSSVGREVQVKIDILEKAVRERKDCAQDLKKKLAEYKDIKKNLEANSKKQNLYRQYLTEKKINGVIATSTWREGVDIPTLDVVILAAGGKESQKVLQEIGRGHRTDQGRKSTFKIIDFYNPSNKFLIEHFGARLMEYIGKKWEFIYED